MRYYTIRPSRDILEIGEYPQTTIHSSIAHNFYDVKRNVFPDFLPSGALDLSPNAKDTDYIESGAVAFGYIINLKFKRILESCALPPNRFYPISVFQRGEKIDYYWFHYLSSVKNYLNVNQTKLTLFNKFSFDVIQDDISMDTISNIEDFQKILPSDQALRIKKIALTKEFPNYDVLNINVLFDVIPLISENLKVLLEKSNLKGFFVKEYELLQYVE